jgi:murein L,D-transpeptidase YcbB/YkuD
VRIALASIIGSLIAVIAVVLAGLAIATDDTGPDLGRQLSEVQTSVTNIEQAHGDMEAALARAQVIAAMTALNAVAFHQVDEEMQAATEIPAGTLGVITNARRVTQGTSWPSDLADHSTVLLSALEEFESALQADDLAAAKTTSMEAHAAFHSMEQVAYSYIAGDEQAGEDGHSDSNGGAEGDHAE